MSKNAKPRNRGYDDDYIEDEYGRKKKDRKKQQKKAKYFDEFDSYEAHNRFNTRSQRFRIY